MSPACLVALLLGAATLGGGCAFDWTVRGGGGSGGVLEKMCDGSAACVCPAGEQCDLSCPGAVGCQLVCEAGATCTMHCDGAVDCSVSCATGATCDIGCYGAECAIECAAGAACEIDCPLGSTCACTGAGC